MMTFQKSLFSALPGLNFQTKAQSGEVPGRALRARLLISRRNAARAVRRQIARQTKQLDHDPIHLIGS